VVLSATVLSAAFLGLVVELMIRCRDRMLAAALITSNGLCFALVNPVERGIDVITASPLYAFVRSHRALLKDKWVVFSDSMFESGFLAATGCNVYTGNRFLPDIDHFSLLASRGVNVEAANNLGYLVARDIPPGQHTSFEPSPSPAVTYWNVSPLDPILPALGVKYVAFVRPPPSEVASKLIPLSDTPLDNFWLFRLP